MLTFYEKLCPTPLLNILDFLLLFIAFAHHMISLAKI